MRAISQRGAPLETPIRLVPSQAKPYIHHYMRPYNSYINGWFLRLPRLLQSPGDGCVLLVRLEERIQLTLLDTGIRVVHITVMCLICTDTTERVHPLGISWQTPIPTLRVKNTLPESQNR